jgi:hypothetical protein
MELLAMKNIFDAASFCGHTISLVSLDKYLTIEKLQLARLRKKQ